jgi:ABC-type branched-subunit amino acid transport system permease subunit
MRLEANDRPGVAGVLLANLQNFATPMEMSWFRSGEFLVMVIIGGTATVEGPVIGALAFQPAFRPRRLRQRVNRSAHSLIPPLRRTKAASGSAIGLYSSAYRSDHLDRVRLSTL